MIAVNDVFAGYGNVAIVRGVTLTVAAGEIVALCGPNGAGKTTLLSAICGDLRPLRGGVTLAGEDVARLPVVMLARRRAVLEQSPSIRGAFTVGQLARLALPPDVSPDEVDWLALEALAAVGLSGRDDEPVSALSGGQQRRAHLARVLAQIGACDPGAAALILDEPTAGLDVAQAVAVMQAMRRAAANGAAVIATVHDLGFAAAFADRIALMSGGKIVADAPPAETLTATRLSDVFEAPISVHHAPDGALTVSPIYPQT